MLNDAILKKNYQLKENKKNQSQPAKPVTWVMKPTELTACKANHNKLQSLIFNKLNIKI